jgi:hypothetical protein
MLSTGWSTYALWRTMNLEDRMQHLIEDQGTPCQLNLLGPYFAKRFAFQVCFPAFLSLDRFSINPGPFSPARRPGLELGCARPFHLPLLASHQGICLSQSPFAHLPVLTYIRCIALIPSGASARRKTSYACMRYGLVQHSTLAACFDISSTVLFGGFGQHPAVRFHLGQCDGSVGRSTS